MNTPTVDQLLTCSTTAYALAYIEQIDAVDTMTRRECVRNINALYGFDDMPPADKVGVLFLRAELRDQINRDWNFRPDPALWFEIGRWRAKNARIDANHDAEYGGEWLAMLEHDELGRAIERAQQPSALLTEDAPDRLSDAPGYVPTDEPLPF